MEIPVLYNKLLRATGNKPFSLSLKKIKICNKKLVMKTAKLGKILKYDLKVLMVS